MPNDRPANNATRTHKEREGHEQFPGNTYVTKVR